MFNNKKIINKFICIYIIINNSIIKCLYQVEWEKKMDVLF